MAPGNAASRDTTSSASLASMISSASLASMTSTSGWSGTLKPGPRQNGIPPPRRNPPMLRMVLEALQAGEQRRGTSVMAIKVYILQKYPTVDAVRLKHLLKRALDTGMQRGLLIRPTNSKARGATGSFRLVPKQKKKIQPRKKTTMPAPPRPGMAKEEAPRKGGQTNGEEARVGKARKAPPQPDKATKAPPGATGPHGKSEVKGRKDNPAGAKAHGKTKAETQNSKPMVAKVENGVTSPAKKKTGNKVLKKATAPGARKGLRAKATAVPKDSESKMVSVPLTRKTEVPKGPRRPGMPTKSSSKVTSMKAEAKS